MHANGINFRENERTLIRLRSELREKWREKKETTWRELVKRTDLEKKPKRFRKEVGNMMERSKGKVPDSLKDENGRNLNTVEEVGAAL